MNENLFLNRHTTLKCTGGMKTLSYCIKFTISQMDTEGHAEFVLALN